MSDKAAQGRRLALLASAELDELRSQLAHARNGRDRAVHKARKALQRLRAIVRLLAPVNAALASDENVAMRALRRRLAPLRDAAARAETFRLLATRRSWKAHAPILRQLAQLEVQRHALAWKDHPPASEFWASIERDYQALAARAVDWPFTRLDGAALESTLKSSGKRLRRAVCDALGEHGRRLRHEMRRKLRRHAILRRAVEAATGAEDPEVDLLLGLAKRCGHEGDLWMAVASARRAAQHHPEWLALVHELEALRRAQCRRHDALLQRAGLV